MTILESPCGCLQIEASWLLFVIVVAFEIGFLSGRKFGVNISVQTDISISQNRSTKALSYRQYQLEDSQKFSSGQLALTHLQQPQANKTEEFTQENKKQEDQLLKQRLVLEGKKLQTRGIFEMRIEKSQKGNHLRKIQKHEVITDYQFSNQSPVSLQTLPDSNSLLQISIYQNYMKNLSSPLVERKIINMSQKSLEQDFSRIFCENGRFKKLYTEAIKIGAGGFGTVFAAKSVIENKHYAIKKLHLKDIKRRKQLMREVSITSSFTHQNIVRFHTCWIQEVQFDFQHFLQNRHILEEFVSENQLESGDQANRHSRRRSLGIQAEQISYISETNSGFAFESVSGKQSSPRLETIKQLQGHKNIVPFKQFENQPSLNQTYSLYIQMELCKDGTLAHYLHRRNRVSAQFSFHIISQLVEGVQYLHTNGVVHRDLKPSNIFLNEQQNKIKIGDFGLATLINPMNRQEEENCSLDDAQGLHRGKKGKVHQKVGTPSYIAPEILKNLPISDMRSVDVYAIGVIYYELLQIFNTSHERVDKLNKLKENIVEGLEEYKSERKLIKMMTKKNRLPLDQIKMRKQFTQLREKYTISAK